MDRSCLSCKQNCVQIFSTLAFDQQCTVTNVACLFVDMYLYVCMDISGIRNNTSIILTKFYLRVTYSYGSGFLPFAEQVMYFQIWMTHVMFQLHSGQE